MNEQPSERRGAPTPKPGYTLDKAYCEIAVANFLKDPYEFVENELALSNINIRHKAKTERWRQMDDPEFSEEGYTLGMVLMQHALGMQRQYNEEPVLLITFTSQLNLESNFSQTSPRLGSRELFERQQGNLIAVLKPYLDTSNPNVRSLKSGEAESIWQGARHYNYLVSRSIENHATGAV